MQEDLTNFLKKIEYDYNLDKSNLNESDFIDNMQILCGKIEKKIIATIQYFQVNEHGIEMKSEVKKMCKELNLKLSVYEDELKKLAAETRNKDYENFYGSILKEFRNDQNMLLLPNYRDIESEFLDYIKIETPKLKINNIKVQVPFLVGLKFATGEAQKYKEAYRNNTLNFDDITNILGFLKTDRPYISSTFNMNKKSNKNIYNKRKVMLLLEEHCLQNRITMCQEFLDKLEDIKIDKI